MNETREIDNPVWLSLVRHLQGQIDAFRQRIATLVEEVRQLRERNAALEAEILELRAEIERLRKEAASPPSFVKRSRKKPEGEKPPRKKRAVNFARRREEPTRTVDHKLKRCPDCDGPLSEGYEKRRRQVIELPETPAEVVDHVIYAHWCSYCEKEQVAEPTAEELSAVGECRLGVRLMSLITTLRTEGRIPLATIQTLLWIEYGLKVSVGEWVEVLHRVAKAGEKEAERILETVRNAPVAQADETSWREDGENGWLWVFLTPPESAEPVRYYHYDPSRGGVVVTTVLGEEYGGTLVSDFYAAYNVHLGYHQRCWSHLLDDVKDLKAKHPEDAGIQAWAKGVKTVYEAAKEWRPEHPGTRWEEKERLQAQREFEERLMALAKPFLTDPTAAQHTLSKRIERFRPELFVFVADPRVPADNNASERSLRPSVIARKISGGTRSSKGSTTRTTLMTLFGTWKLQGKDVLDACRRLLLASSKAKPAAA